MVKQQLEQDDDAEKVIRFQPLSPSSKVKSLDACITPASDKEYP